LTMKTTSEIPKVQTKKPMKANKVFEEIDEDQINNSSELLGDVDWNALISGAIKSKKRRLSLTKLRQINMAKKNKK